jgi:hypothetical protein
MIAPPSIAVESNPEALPVEAPSPLTERENIDANIIELHNPTAIISHTAILPLLNTDPKINTIAIRAITASTFWV